MIIRIKKRLHDAYDWLFPPKPSEIAHECFREWRWVNCRCNPEYKKEVKTMEEKQIFDISRCNHEHSISLNHKYCCECGIYLEPIIETLNRYYIEIEEHYNHLSIMRQYRDNGPVPIASFNFNEAHSLKRCDAEALAKALVRLLNDCNYDESMEGIFVGMSWLLPNIKKGENYG